MTVELVPQGAARIVRIERTGKHNALDRATMRDLARVARALRRDKKARGVVLCGAGSIFAAGGDLREFANVKTDSGARRIAAAGHDLVDTFWEAGIPLVAAVNGDAYGGACELVTACDYRIVESQSRFHWVQGRFAVTTAWGATARLAFIVGPSVAARWLLTARTVDSTEALAARFADEVVPTGKSVERACAFVEEIARCPAVTTRRQLLLLRSAPHRSRDEARMSEVRAFAACWTTAAHHEAVRRFFERDAAPKISDAPGRARRRMQG